MRERGRQEERRGGRGRQEERMHTGHASMRCISKGGISHLGFFRVAFLLPLLLASVSFCAVPSISAFLSPFLPSFLPFSLQTHHPCPPWPPRRRARLFIRCHWRPHSAFLPPVTRRVPLPRVLTLLFGNFFFFVFGDMLLFFALCSFTFNPAILHIISQQ